MSEIHNKTPLLGNTISSNDFYMIPHSGPLFFDSDMLINKPGCYVCFSHNFGERQIQNGRHLFFSRAKLYCCSCLGLRYFNVIYSTTITLMCHVSVKFFFLYCTTSSNFTISIQLNICLSVIPCQPLEITCGPVNSVQVNPVNYMYIHFTGSTSPPLSS